jgi:putative spermidine/putrescine transport system permease protein
MAFRSRDLQDAPTRVGRWGLATVAAVVAVFLTMPILITVPISFSSIDRVTFPPPGLSLRWYAEFFGVGGHQGSRWMPAAKLSVQVGIVSAILATGLGGLAAIPLARMRFRGKRLIETFVMLPLILPPIVLAVGLFFLYIPTQLLGTWFGIVLGHTVLGAPYVTVIVAAALRNFDDRLEWAAASLGAGRWRVLWTVTVPLLRPAILSGALFAFLTSFDELIIALFVSGTTSVTLPRLLWDFVRTETSPVIAVVSTLLLLFSVLFAGGLAIVQGRRNR